MHAAGYSKILLAHKHKLANTHL